MNSNVDDAPCDSSSYGKSARWGVCVSKRLADLGDILVFTGGITVLNVSAVAAARYSNSVPYWSSYCDLLIRPQT